MEVSELFSTLHNNPEFSEHETKTLEILKTYIKENTDLKIVDHNNFFYGIHDENADRTIAVRADIDAIANSEGKAFHGCGHDGHSSMACEAARLLSGKKIGKNVIFLFQPAEENGAGAKSCFPMFDENNIDLILGLHNIPSYKMGTVLLTKDSFADASTGICIKFTGAQSHAGCPEEGLNPGFAISNLVCKLDEIINRDIYEKPVLSTLICVNVGEKNYGINAGYGELCLTLRAQKSSDLSILVNTVLDEAKKSVEEVFKDKSSNVTISYELLDEFPSTENTKSEAERICKEIENSSLDYKYLDRPMRWSEDFGNYREKSKSFFLGLGAGEDHPGLHTEEYCFPKELLEIGAKTWVKIIELA